MRGVAESIDPELAAAHTRLVDAGRSAREARIIEMLEATARHQRGLGRRLVERALLVAHFVVLLKPALVQCTVHGPASSAAELKRITRTAFRGGHGKPAVRAMRFGACDGG
jgi:hypothetical protein